MTDIDKLIKQALTEADKQHMKDVFKDPSILDLIGESFRGKMRYLVVMVWVLIPLFLAGAIYCTVEFFMTDVIMDQIGWAVGFLVFFLIVVMLKIWYWLELSKQTIRRDIKRLELRLIALTQSDNE